MSVRVNLLPEATKERSRATQQRGVAMLVALVLLAGLGGAYWWASSQVSEAEERLMAAQTQTAELESEKGELVAFQDLADRRESSDELLRAALAGEVSLGGVLQDVAAVTPSDTQIESLSVTLAASETGDAVGTFALTGKTLTSHAPGVEAVLIQLDKVVSFADLYLNSSTLDDVEDSVATFSLDGQIGPEAATNRYTDGLPEELR